MQNIEKEAPEVLKSFRELTKSLDSFSTIDIKTKELILLGIFTADKSVKGISTHTKLALENGATKNEIISAILFAMPIVGIPSVTLSLQMAVDTIKNYKGE